MCVYICQTGLITCTHTHTHVRRRSFFSRDGSRVLRPPVAMDWNCITGLRTLACVHPLDGTLPQEERDPCQLLLDNEILPLRVLPLGHCAGVFLHCILESVRSRERYRSGNWTRCSQPIRPVYHCLILRHRDDSRCTNQFSYSSFIADKYIYIFMYVFMYRHHVHFIPSNANEVGTTATPHHTIKFLF